MGNLRLKECEKALLEVAVFGFSRNLKDNRVNGTPLI
jgi:hypothetical protein